MALWHGKFETNDPCNTLYRNWDEWSDAHWARLIADSKLLGDLWKANMLYTRFQPRYFHRLLLPPAQ